jgi:glycosyltransferase involved in cell wall biosynthesis
MHIAEAGGPPQHVLPWLQAASRTASVEVVVPGRGAAETLYASFARTHVLPYCALTLPTGPLDTLRFATRFARQVQAFERLLRERAPDVVFVVTTVVPAALVAARRVRIPTVVYAAEIDDVTRRGRPMKALAVSALRRVTCASASAIVCCSDAVARQYDRGRAQRMSTIAPELRPSEFAGDRLPARRAFGLVHADPCIAVLGNITPRRGQADLLRALPTLRRSFPRVRCIVAGVPLDRPPDLEYRAFLERLVDEIGVRDLVTFAGFVDPVADVYAAADVVVNPAHANEGLGRVALEALVAGRPVVATRVGATPEILSDGIDALLVPPGRPDAIAEAVAALWSDASLRRRLVANGRARVVANFVEQPSAERFLSVLASVRRAEEGSSELPLGQRGGTQHRADNADQDDQQDEAVTTRRLVERTGHRVERARFASWLGRSQRPRIRWLLRRTVE